MTFPRLDKVCIPEEATTRQAIEAVALLPPDWEQFGMTDVVDAAIASGRRVGGFPIREFWLDIGQFVDYERANDDHATHFAAR